MADISGYLNTIASGVYGRDIKSAIYNALQALSNSSGEKYEYVRDITNSDMQNVIISMIENGWLSGTNGPQDPITNTRINLDKDVVRAFMILYKAGILGGSSDSEGSTGYKIYTYFRARADANGIPRWAQPTIYKLMHKVGIDELPLLRGIGDPLTSDPVLIIGDDNLDYPFVYDTTPLSSSEQRGLYNIKLNISSEMLRTLVIIDRSGYFEDLDWTSINCDAPLP